MLHNQTITLVSISDVRKFIKRHPLLCVLNEPEFVKNKDDKKKRSEKRKADEIRRIAKIKMWLFYKANKNYLYEDIKELREDIIDSLVKGRSMVDSFYLKK